MLTKWLLPQQYPLLYPSQKSGITMSTGQTSHSQPDEEAPIIENDRAVLVYINDAGAEHEQPLGDLPESGTLVDPDSGADMTLIGVRVLTLSEVERRAWAAVAQAMRTAKAMHFDGCHKIYLSMDEAEVKNMKSLGYDVVAPDITLLTDWFKTATCGLRFISAVRTDLVNPNNGFTQLIPQSFEEAAPEDATDNAYVR